MMDLKVKFKKRNYQQNPMEAEQSVESVETASEESEPRITGPEVPDGLLRKCNHCGSAILTEDAKNRHYVCPKCGAYFRLPAFRRIAMIGDPDSFEEWDTDLAETNPLKFKGYDEKLRQMKSKTGLDEAVITGKISIEGHSAVIGVCDGRFMMASMGQIVGEKITRAIERATECKLPVILFTCSGGARMQEGIVSLMQMAKTSAALKRHSDAGLLYITVLTDPTTGGVTASFAMLGDIILAEPGALVGFAGPRVIEQTIGQKLPKGFQRAEFLLEHGFVDQIVERKDMRETLGRILAMHAETKSETAEDNIINDAQVLTESRVNNPEERPEITGKKIIEQNTIANIPGNAEESSEIEKKVLKLSAWNRVMLSRKAERPVGSDYIHALFDDFMEFHGDRYCKDDPAIVGGIAWLQGQPVTVIAQEKGKNTKDNMKRNFGMPSPDGYRKALRLMKQAEKFHRPVICFVDTPGAFCGMEAEERGQGEAIARNLYEMSALGCPVLSIFVGEGGSGGALALAVADEVWMMENAIYSILSPEGFASILWKDAKRAPEAAEVMKLTSNDLLSLGIIEKVIPEQEIMTCEMLESLAPELKDSVADFLQKYGNMSEDTLSMHRYQRFRNF